MSVKHLTLAFVSTILLHGCRTSNAVSDVKAVYGDDNRRDLNAADNRSEAVTAARSTGFLTLNSQLVSDGAKSSRLKGSTVSQALATFPLETCPDTRFKDQPVASGCSGFLAAPDIFVTAGHCVLQPFTCSSIAIVFDYALGTSGKDATLIPKAQTYGCKAVLAAKYENKIFIGGRTMMATDYAVIQLDRVVTDRAPLKISTAGSAAKGTALTLIGHPYGMPTKIVEGGSVRASDPNLLTTTVDANEGNSGSAVLNSSSLEVEGILIAGERDDETKPLTADADPNYVFDGKHCMTWKKCKTDGCVGEFVLPAAVWRSAIP